jgi:hypothetical protein
MNVDMSKAAITARLEEFSQVWRLCMTLKNSRLIKNATNEFTSKKVPTEIENLEAKNLVEMRGIEPLTSALRTPRSPS